METRSAKQIINSLAEDAKVKDACRKLGGHNWEDLYQELFVILCETEKEKLEKIDQEGYLHFWIVRTLMNNTTTTGNFYKKYHIIHVEQEREKGLAQAEEEDGDGQQIHIRQREVVEAVLTELETKGRERWSWYKVNMIRLYAEINNYSEIARLTGIPFKTVKDDITKFRGELAVIINQRI